MNHCTGSPFYSIKGFPDNMFSGLGQNLDGNILRNHIPFDQHTDKLVLCFGSSRKTHFNFLESDPYQQLEKLNLLFYYHRFNQCLITIT